MLSVHWPTIYIILILDDVVLIVHCFISLGHYLLKIHMDDVFTIKLRTHVFSKYKAQKYFLDAFMDCV